MSKSLNNLFNTKTIPLLALVGVIVFMGFSSIFYHDGSAHWMEGPGIAILVAFMPLTAISFLHFRLPEKQEEFATIKKMLQADIDVSESFTVILRQDNSGSGYLLPICFLTFFSVLGFYILLSGRAVILFNGMEWVDHGSSLMRDISHSAITEYVSRFDTYNYRRGVVAAGMSFLGAYIWSIQYIFRRMITLDLPPGVYYSISSRMIYSVFLAVVLQHFMSVENNAADYFLKNQLIPISFWLEFFRRAACCG